MKTPIHLTSSQASRAGLGQKRKSKYGAVPTILDGVRFHSKKEAKRYVELKMLEKAGKIHSLRCQWKFPLTVHGEKLGNYVADFTYYEDTGNGFFSLRVEDTKGFRTPLYRWKKRHFEAQHVVKITEI